MAKKIDIRAYCEQAFRTLGFTPRGHQLDYVELMVTACIEHGVTDIVLSASTGTGKSIIGLAFAEAVTAIDSELNPQHYMYYPKNGDREPYMISARSLIMTLTNALSEQYQKSFETVDCVMRAKGRATYDCEQFTDGTTAEECVRKEIMEGKIDLPQSTCMACKYYQATQKYRSMPHIITNYTMFFIHQLYTEQAVFNTRGALVFDETHSFNDAYASFGGVVMSKKSIVSLFVALCEYLPLPGNMLDEVNTMFAHALAPGGIMPHHAFELMEKINDLVKELKDACSRLLDDVAEVQTVKRVKKIAAAFETLATNITFFTEHMYEHVIDSDVSEDGSDITVTVRPIFVGEMYKWITANTRFRLLMSGTISEEYITHTMGVDPDKVLFVHVPHTFPVESKKIEFYKPLKLNYSTMKDPKTVDSLLTNINEILAMHPDEKGLIITPSFAIANQVELRLRSSHKKIVHRSGTKLPDLVYQHKVSKTPSVLISPSVHTGHDFPDDASRFQIIVKCQYPSLGDLRMKYIADYHSFIYRNIALTTMVQSAGRGTRHESDWSKTYILDVNAQQLWKSNENIWRDEFYEV